MKNKFLHIIFIIFIISCSDGNNQFGGYNDPNAFDGINLENPLGMNFPLDTQIYYPNNDFKKTIGSLFGNNIPKIFIFGYYNCPMLCNSIRDNLFSELAKTDLNLGEDYQIMMFSIDPSESIYKAYSDRDLYFDRYFINNKHNNRDYMNFMVSDQNNIDKITKSLGFDYRYDSESEEFFHPAFIYVVSDQGIVTSGLKMGPISDIIKTELDRARNNIPSMNFDQFYAFTCMQKDIENKNPNRAFELVQFAGIWFISSLGFCFTYRYLANKEEK